MIFILEIVGPHRDPRPLYQQGYFTSEGEAAMAAEVLQEELFQSWVEAQLAHYEREKAIAANPELMTSEERTLRTIFDLEDLEPAAPVLTRRAWCEAVEIDAIRPVAIGLSPREEA